jgi:hypothetical protein
MLQEFEIISIGIQSLISEWETKLSELPQDIITLRRNIQQRSIKQILGHMIDSASNNIHRIVHMQYQTDPSAFPNYASNGNNDRWIAIQNYQEEDWQQMILLWKCTNLHLIHVISNVNPFKLNNRWNCSNNKYLTLRQCIEGYLRHFKLHLDEIDNLINMDSTENKLHYY